MPAVFNHFQPFTGRNTQKRSRLSGDDRLAFLKNGNNHARFAPPICEKSNRKRSLRQDTRALRRAMPIPYTTRLSSPSIEVARDRLFQALKITLCKNAPQHQNARLDARFSILEAFAEVICVNRSAKIGTHSTLGIFTLICVNCLIKTLSDQARLEFRTYNRRRKWNAPGRCQGQVLQTFGADF